MPAQALSQLRICDFTGQLAGAGATRFLAAFGAQVIRVEDPATQGRWDILRGAPPFVDDRRGGEFGGQFQNHNVEKLGVTINLRTEPGKDLLRRLIAVSDVVAENFSAGVMDRLGFSYDEMRALRPDIVYVSNCGFGHSGPYVRFKTWGPVVQALSTGQLAGAGATRFLAAFGAQVIRVEDPATQGRWDILRGAPPFVDDRRGGEFGGQFQNHNVEKLGVTINLRTEPGKDLLRRLIAVSDVVAENFSAGVMDRLGFSYDEMRALRPDIVYVSNCGFGHTGPYVRFKTWGPVVQAVSGLTFSSGLPGRPSAGWGYSYMDHTGGYYMAMAIMMALHHRNVTGEGQWVDLSTVEAGVTLNGPALLDHAANGRPLRRAGMPHSNRGWPGRMAPHGIYPAAGDDAWIAIACRHDADWAALAAQIAEPWAGDAGLAGLAGRLAELDTLDDRLAAWTARHDATALAARLQESGVPASRVQTPEQRIEEDPATAAWGLWPEVQHPLMGAVRVDGLPLRLSETDWEIARGAPLLGQHNDVVFGDLLGVDRAERDQLRAAGVI